MKSLEWNPAVHPEVPSEVSHVFSLALKEGAFFIELPAAACAEADLLPEACARLFQGHSVWVRGGNATIEARAFQNRVQQEDIGNDVLRLFENKDPSFVSDEMCFSQAELLRLIGEIRNRRYLSEPDFSASLLFEAPAERDLTALFALGASVGVMRGVADSDKSLRKIATRRVSSGGKICVMLTQGYALIFPGSAASRLFSIAYSIIGIV